MCESSLAMSNRPRTSTAAVACGVWRLTARALEPRWRSSTGTPQNGDWLHRPLPDRVSPAVVMAVARAPRGQLRSACSSSPPAAARALCSCCRGEASARRSRHSSDPMDSRASRSPSSADHRSLMHRRPMVRPLPVESPRCALSALHHHWYRHGNVPASVNEERKSVRTARRSGRTIFLFIADCASISTWDNLPAGRHEFPRGPSRLPPRF